MDDRDFLIWVHERLANVHCDNELMDFMHKLRAIIAATPAGQATPNMLVCNSMEELKVILAVKDGA